MTPLPVVAAVIEDGAGRVLLARRPEHAHQGGLWEFPGGKMEAGEPLEAALARELEEELGIRPNDARPWVQVRHRYADKAVHLHFFRVGAFTGTPRGREGQTIAWHDTATLEPALFPAANRPVVNRLRLPDRYLVTPDPGPDQETFLTRLEAALAAGVSLVQLRAPGLAPAAYADLAAAVLPRVRAHGARLLLNADPGLARELGADGVHLNGTRLATHSARPLPDPFLVAASVHDAGQLARAEALGVDFVCLSPVLPTASHPEANPLGWDRFRDLAGSTPLPVYALGGLIPVHLPQAKIHGAQGIAAIRGLWEQSGGSRRQNRIISSLSKS